MPFKSFGFLTATLAAVLIAACIAVLTLSGGGTRIAAGSDPETDVPIPGYVSRAEAPATPAQGKLYVGVDVDAGNVAQFDTELGISQPAILGSYVAENGQLSSVLQAGSAYSGTAPMVSWSIDFTQNITDGSMDAYLKEQAAEVVDYGKPVFLRPDWEMDGSWYPDWSPPKVSAARYVADWRYIVRLFRAAGAGNAAFVWCPNVGEPIGSAAQDWYPGDAYVDWVGTDVYPRQSAGTSFVTEADGLDQLAAFAQQHGKPMMLAEWGVTSPDPDDGWLFDLVFQWAAEYPETVKALVYFDYVGAKGDHLLVDHPNGAAEFAYLVHTDHGALTAVPANGRANLG